MQTRNAESGDILKGAIAGFAGGLAGSWAMNQFQAAISAVGGDEQEADQPDAPEPATVQAAEALSKGVIDHPLTRREKQWAGPAMHYGFGGVMGAIYGVATEVLPAAKAGTGSGYGAALWLAADEAVVPALGLAGPPQDHPASTHASALASHLVYGFTTELVRRGVRAVI